MTIVFAPQAAADFAAVIGYLAERNPIAAQDFGERIFALIDKLAAGDFEGPEQPLTSGDIVRSWAKLAEDGPCEDVCENEVCLTAAKGVTSISGFGAPGSMIWTR